MLHCTYIPYKLFSEVELVCFRDLEIYTAICIDILLHDFKNKSVQNRLIIVKNSLKRFFVCVRVGHL